MGQRQGKTTTFALAITSPFPHFHLYDSEVVQGWKKMFYLLSECLVKIDIITLLIVYGIWEKYLSFCPLEFVMLSAVEAGSSGR